MLKFQTDKLRLGYAPTRRDMFRDPLYRENRKAIDEAVIKLAGELDVELVTIDDLPFESKSYGFGKRLVNAQTVHVAEMRCRPELAA